MSPSIAQRYGRRWSAGAAVRAEHYAAMSLPAWLAVADATGIGPGTRVLDVACGSGEFALLAADRGAPVCGIDAATGMIDLARRLVPAADLRVGTLEELPWDDARFDVVTGFNAFQFAADMVGALAEAGRVTRPGGRVVICNWGPVGDCDLIPVVHSLADLQPGPPLVARRPIGDAGVLEELAASAGLVPQLGGLVDVPYAPPDRTTLMRGLLSAGNVLPAVEHSGEERVRSAIDEAAAPFRAADGSYLFRNTYRYLVTTPAPQTAEAPSA
jgi:SAM-dependent methyltransferase